MTTNSWLSAEDINNETADQSGRPISPAPLVDGDLNSAETIKVEFPDNGQSVTMDRRDFVRLGGAATAAAGLTATVGCQVPTETIVPYANSDGSIIPGKANFYATSIGGVPARVRTRAGKPNHIEGNSSHPNGVNGTTARQGAAILDLYDPDRAEGPARIQAGKAITSDWASLDKAVVDALRASGGKTRLLTGPVTGWATQEAINEFLGGIAGGTRVSDMHIAWQPDGYDNLRAASQDLMGIAGLPDYRLAETRCIVSFGADFLDTFISPERFTSHWAQARNVENRGDKMVTTTVFESRLTLTGANADRRFRVRQNELINVAGAIARLIAEQHQVEPAIVNQLKGFDASAIATQAGVTLEDLKLVAKRLVDCAGSSAVFGGGNFGSKALDSMALLINEMLGNIGTTVVPGGSLRGASGFKDLLGLVTAINKKQVDTLIIAGTNPVYLGAALGVESALKNVKNVIYIGDRLDETGSKANWFAPLAHDLECWGDSATEVGMHALQQPSIRPMNDSRGLLDHLIAWSNLKDSNGRVTWTMGGRLHTASNAAEKAAKEGETPSAAYYYLRDSWNSRFFRQNTESGKTRLFNEALRVGYFMDMEAATAAANLNMATLKTLPSRGGEVSNAWDVLLTSSVAFGDGEGVQPNNGWLQELPDPITHVVWDSIAQISPRSAREMDLKDGDSVQVTVGSNRLLLPMIAQPGLADKTVVIPVGLGRSAVGAVGNGIGVNAYALLTNNGSRVQAGEVVVAEGWSEVARIGDDDSRDGRGKDLRNNLINNTLRPLCPEASLDEWSKKNSASHAAAAATGHDADAHGAHAVEHFNHEYGGATYEPHGEHKAFSGGHPGPSNWKSHEYNGYRWAMTIDTNTCTGCNACVIACQSENNIAVVGKKGVLANREMAWLRIDRYYAFDRQADNVNAAAKHQDWDHLAPTPEGALDNPKVHFQPMLCQHCENAGCETVCPFTASMHDEEGVNQQVYNRCVGTRYCANNCAYKVRRYNWFEYSFERTNWLTNLANPESKNQARYNNAGDLNNRYNPEVTVRTRGVMEKCSFCTQRIQSVKQGARSEGRQIRDDGELQTACQAACPGNSISFGDINNPETSVAQQVAAIRSYRILEEVGAKPSVFYLTRIWNA
jgi:Fe-S-cluster-containing dehydrogenase component/anaerobic selenocysteine-containing dehydrogenase